MTEQNLFETNVFELGDLWNAPKIRCRLCRRRFWNWQGVANHGRAERRKHPDLVRVSDTTAARWGFHVASTSP